MVATSKPMMSLVSSTVDQTSIALGSSASCSKGTLKAQSSNSKLTSTERPVAERQKNIGTKLSNHNFE